MEPCPGCGASTEPGDRFCPACGDAVAGPPSTVDGYGGWGSGDAVGEPELLLLEPVPARPLPGGAPAGAASRSTRGWLAAAAGVLAVAVALWAFSRGGSGPGGGDDDATRPLPTTVPGTDPTAAEAGTEPGATDTTADPDAVPVYDPETGAPVLGRPTGWSLLIGRSADTALERLDLDTGQRVRYDGVTGGPVAVADGRLVLQRQHDDGTVSLGLVPLDDPAAEGTEIAVGNLTVGYTWPLAPADDGGLWVYNATAGATSWRLVRVRDGKLLDEVSAPPAFVVGPVDGGGPDVATSVSSGVYRRDRGSRYRLVSPGRPLTVSEGAVLVDVCSLPITCRLGWIDVDSGEPVDRPLPTGDAGIEWAGSAGTSGRFLVGWRSGRVAYTGDLVLYDLVQGRVVDAAVDFGVGQVAASPDGRYLAVEAQLYVHIYDVEQDRWVAVHRTGDASASLLFVPNGAG